jgi:two-component sensor histidine kinase
LNISSEEYDSLRRLVSELQRENTLLRKGIRNFSVQGETVSVPQKFEKIFERAQETVGRYFTGLNVNPSEGVIDIGGERYVLMRASALSYDFIHKIMDLYSDRGVEEAILIGKNFLFDIAHVIGIEDARNFHEVMNLKDPVEKLSAGPVHFAYTGWAYVNILPESNPTADDHFFLKYRHPNSFEADSWIKTGIRSTFPVCVMNSGYSSGWCEESFGIQLTAVEISCRAKGDEHCTFIMAPPGRISEYLEKENIVKNPHVFDIPVFFERKKAEEKIKASLAEKDVLLKEIHHRVKNNLQIISSLLKLQSGFVNDPHIERIINDSQNRIKTMAIVHEKLYQSNLESVSLGDYIQSIVQLSSGSYTNKNIPIHIDFDIPAEQINIKIDLAIPCGLIINEIITNAFKYAFEGNSSGIIRIHLRKKDNNIYLVISDNGIGITNEIDPENSGTFGLELIRLLVQQLEGKITTAVSQGTSYEIEFPLEEEHMVQAE